jgi:uncharacterized protein YeaO (DUF488 family)
MTTDRRTRITVRRVYDTSTTAVRGYRVLVDRLWPRGVAKADAPIDEWLKDAAPSTELRRWYGHDPSRFDEFARRYRDELAHPPAHAAVEHLATIAEHEHLALVTATRDVEHSGAEVLRQHLAHTPGPEP